MFQMTQSAGALAIDLWRLEVLAVQVGSVECVRSDFTGAMVAIDKFVVPDVSRPTNLSSRRPPM
jgi:hypothetical protein